MEKVTGAMRGFLPRVADGNMVSKVSFPEVGTAFPAHVPGGTLALPIC